MAEATTADAPVETSAAPPAKRGGKGLLIALLLLIVVVAAAVAGWYFFLRTPAATPSTAVVVKPAPEYLEVSPNFVVNLDDPDTMRYLQVDVQLVAHDKSALNEADSQMPLIRNALLLLFAQQHYADLISRQGKEALQQKALAEVRRVLKSSGSKAVIDRVIFTSFVMQ